MYNFQEGCRTCVQSNRGGELTITYAPGQSLSVLRATARLLLWIQGQFHCVSLLITASPWTPLYGQYANILLSLEADLAVDKYELMLFTSSAGLTSSHPLPSRRCNPPVSWLMHDRAHISEFTHYTPLM
jgi:hypothetical protein